MPEWFDFAQSLFVFLVGFVVGYLVKSIRDEDN